MSKPKPGWFPDIAPHVEPRWREAFVLELRLAGVGGERVGAALAEVESHVVESGETAADAFGEPTVYARSLGLPPRQKQSAATNLRAALPTLVQMPGIMLAITAAENAATGEPIWVRPGVVIATIVGAVLFLCALRWSTPLVRAVVRRGKKGPIIAGVVGAGLVAGLILLGLVNLGDGPGLNLPSRWTLGISLATVAAGAAWALLAAPRQVDLIRAPLEDATAHEEVAVITRQSVLATRLVLLAPAVVTVALVVAKLVGGAG